MSHKIVFDVLPHHNLNILRLINHNIQRSQSDIHTKSQIKRPEKARPDRTVQKIIGQDLGRKMQKIRAFSGFLGLEFSSSAVIWVKTSARLTILITTSENNAYNYTVLLTKT